jgi:hypothetical protein
MKSLRSNRQIRNGNCPPGLCNRHAEVIDITLAGKSRLDM